MAFRRIIAAHHDDMRRACVYVAGDRAIADEATQAAWVIAWKKIGNVREPRPKRYEAASPASNVDGETMPFLIIHGLDDETVHVQSDRNLVHALTAAGREVVYAERPKAHLMSLLSDGLTWALIDAFLADRLSPEHW